MKYEQQMFGVIVRPPDIKKADQQGKNGKQKEKGYRYF